MRRTRSVAALLAVGAVAAFLGIAQAAPNDTTLVSRSGAAGSGGDNVSVAPSVSQTGRFVAFESVADNLDPADSDGDIDVFVKDLDTGVATLASDGVTFASNAEPNLGGLNNGPSISGDGRFVAFTARQSVPVDPADDHVEVYVHDSQAPASTIAISPLTDGKDATAPQISQDGAFVAYHTDDGQGEGVGIYVWTRAGGATAQLSAKGSRPSISGDGALVAYQSEDPAETGAGENVRHVVVKPRTGGAVTNLTLQLPDGRFEADLPAISADGRFVTFRAGSVVNTQVLRRAVDGGPARYVSRAPGHAGALANADVDNGERRLSISADGRYVGFSTAATNLSGADADAFSDSYVRDLVNGETELVSRPTGTGATGDDDSAGAILSADATRVAFDSLADNFSSADVDDQPDVFSRQLDPQPALPPSNVVPPSISPPDDPRTGDVLTCSQGEWNGDPTFAYQWKRDGSAIAGATSASHTLVKADEQTDLTCTVTATNGGGPTAVASDPVQPLPHAPENQSPPQISPSGTVAVGDELQCSQGQWTNDPTSYAYRWRRNLLFPIGGATSSYTVTSDDRGTGIDCVVTATNAGGEGVAATEEVSVPPPPPPPSPPSSPPGGDQSEAPPPDFDAPPPSSAPGCQHKASFGPVDVIASCFKREGETYTSEGDVRLNGIDLKLAKADVGAQKAKIVVEPLRSRITASGTLTVKLGDFTVGVYQSFSIQLPGLTPDLDLPAGPKSLVAGFPVKGSAKFKLVKGGTTGTLSLELPALLGGLSGQATLTATNATGLRLDTLDLKVPQASIGEILGISDVRLSYVYRPATATAPDASTWQGSIKVELPTELAPGIAGGMTLKDGRFVEAHMEVSDLRVPIATGIFLQRLRGSVAIDPLTIGGGIGVSLGPRVGGKEAVSVDGDVSIQLTDPAVFDLSGRIMVLGTQLAKAHVRYITSGRLDFDGGFRFPETGTIVGSFIDVSIKGFVDGSAGFLAEGSGTLSTPLGKVFAEALVSHIGVAACGGFSTPLGKVRAGFGHRWDGTNTEFFGLSCDMGPWRPASGGCIFTCGLPGSARLGRAAAEGIEVPPGMPITAFSFIGQGAPPKVDLSGPGGELVTTPAGLEDLKTERSWVIQNPDNNTTYIAVVMPTAGEWKATAAPGSAPIVGERKAFALPEPSIRANVTGRGHRRTLRWSLKPIPGQVVRFVEEGPQTGREIATATKARGSVRFVPADGRAGKRTILAIVEQDGLPRARLKVGSYLAPSTLRPGRPGLLRVRRRGSLATVSWAAARGAQTYLVLARLSDGRKLLLPGSRRSRRVVIRDLKGKTKMRVSVRGVDARHRQGLPANATLSARRSKR